MKEIKQGEIYLVQWDPSLGHEFKKTRPGIVLSSERVLRQSNLVSFLPITTTTHSPIQEDILIQKNEKNRLLMDSLIKVQHVSSFDKTRIVRHIGDVSDKILDQIKAYLRQHFDL